MARIVCNMPAGDEARVEYGIPVLQVHYCPFACFWGYIRYLRLTVYSINHETTCFLLPDSLRCVVS